MKTNFSIKYYLLAMIMIAPFVRIKGQQDALLTQYMFNTLALNPAYAGTSGMLHAMVASRHQWVGFDDAPSTQTFTIHTPVGARNFGTGLSLIHDKIGPITNTTAWLDYSYQIQVSEIMKLSFGLKGGFSYYQKDFSSYQEKMGTQDPSFAESPESRFLPNFGFGLYLYSNNFYAGISTPRLIENQLSGNENGSGVLLPKENRLYLLMAGYAFPINEELVLRPSFLIRATESAPIAYDLNLNLLIREKMWLGAFYRPGKIIGGMVKYRITNQLSIGYAYDTSIADLTSHFGSSHEAMISFRFDFKKAQVINPRYF